MEQYQISQESNEGKIKCLCCGEMCDNKYCPNCGQTTSTKRLTIKSMFDYIMYGMFKMNGGFLYTVKELLLRPWNVIRDYIRGRRTIYMQPFLTLIAVTLYYAIFSHLLGLSFHFSIDDVLNEFDIKEVNTIGSYYKVAIEYLLNNQFLFSLILILPFIFSIRIAYRKMNAKRFNIAEYIVAATYLLSFSFIIDILLLPFNFIDEGVVSVMSNIILIVYSFITLWKAFPQKWFKQLGSTLLLLFYSVIFSYIYIAILILLNVLIVSLVIK